MSEKYLHEYIYGSELEQAVKAWIKRKRPWLNKKAIEEAVFDVCTDHSARRGSKTFHASLTTPPKPRDSV